MYPLSLLKIGAWRKDLGDECELFSNRLPEPGAFDEIWITTLFTYDIAHAMGLVSAAVDRADRVRVGGVAASLLPHHFERYDCDVHTGLIHEAEGYHPDYSLLPAPPKYSITHTSRGCPRKCGFCMVHYLEPEFEDRPEWPGDIVRGTDKVYFYDNNWLAKPIELLERDAETIRRLLDFRRIEKIDFNQGLDARFLTEEKADLLEGLPIMPVRFAFDHMGEDEHYQNAIRMMVDRGFGIFITYALYNYKDTPQEFYYRLRESVRLVMELDALMIDSYPMRYHPILEPDPKHEHVGPHWTLTKLRGFTAILAAHSGVTGVLSTHSHHKFSPIDEFEYWFGKTADEFDRLIGYPDIRKLTAARKGKLRLMRAQGKEVVL